jgi:hypothetical protein
MGGSLLRLSGGTIDQEIRGVERHSFHCIPADNHNTVAVKELIRAAMK